MKRHDLSALPSSLPPFGVNRVQAAELVGVGCGKFDQMVEDGRMPKAKHIDSRRIWDVDEVRQAFKALDSVLNADEINPWDDM